VPLTRWRVNIHTIGVNLGVSTGVVPSLGGGYATNARQIFSLSILKYK
jgi:hypothetical protein